MKQRTIKFRCWDKELKCMLEMEVKEKQIWFGTVNVFSEILLNHNRFIIMQFTGLLDKKGKEIYCSDIIKEKTKWRQAIYIVTWRTDLACFVISNSTDKKNWYPLFSRSDIETPRCSFIEIIGDIYSNPDLLNNKEGA